jgi:2-keto-myo-inositol isomerase
MSSQFKFAINRTCAPSLALRDFVKLAVEAGAGGVEIRNDIAGREFMDGTPAEEVRAIVTDASLKVASVNALQRFNEWNSTREAEATSLVSYAAHLGAPGVVLCPVHNEDNGWSDAEAEKNLRHGLRMLRPILLDLGVTGYVEPLGMKGSTMKMQKMAVAAVTDIDGWDAYQLCYDTFQFFRCGDVELFPQHIGLAHISGIARQDLAPADLTEPDRVLVETKDRVENLRQLRALMGAGYEGYVSMEPFNPEVQNNPKIAAALQQSFAYLRSSLESSQS